MGFLRLRARRLRSDSWTKKGDTRQSNPPAGKLHNKYKCSVSGGFHDDKDDRDDGGGDADDSAFPVTLGDLTSGRCTFSIYNPFPLRLEQNNLRGGKG